MDLSRREFLAMSAAASVAPHLDPRPSPPSPQAAAPRPVAIASSNGLGTVERAYELMVSEQYDPLDAAIAGVNILELDPNNTSVGLGGLPNEDGVVQLDASCMHGPTRRAGAVAVLEDIATPSLVAKAIMDYTDHVMLVGEGAKRFALAMGFPEQNLLTPESRQDWMRWKSRLNPRDNWLNHDEDVMIKFTHGTINCSAVDTNGDIGSVTTTSGLSWKIPGRVSDSPVVGAGQYCDNRFGAAGSTGRGEANIKTCGAYHVVDQLRLGVSPRDACLSALRRAVEMTEDRLLDEHGRPRYYLEFYAVTKTGEFGAATMYEPRDEEKEFGYGFYAVANADGARLEEIAHLYDVDTRPADMVM